MRFNIEKMLFDIKELCFINSHSLPSSHPTRASRDNRDARSHFKRNPLSVVTIYCHVASWWWCFHIQVLSFQQAEEKHKALSSGILKCTTRTVNANRPEVVRYFRMQTLSWDSAVGSLWRSFLIWSKATCKRVFSIDTKHYANLFSEWSLKSFCGTR